MANDKVNISICQHIIMHNTLRVKLLLKMPWSTYADKMAD